MVVSPFFTNDSRHVIRSPISQKTFFGFKIQHYHFFRNKQRILLVNDSQVLSETVEFLVRTGIK